MKDGGGKKFSMKSSQQAINDNKLRPAGPAADDLRANGEDVTQWQWLTSI